MNTKLSHSQLGRFMMCPESYKQHYINKLRPKVTHAALIFGSAIDNALNALLIPGKETPEVVFEKSFIEAKINDKEYFIPTHQDLVYSNNDMDFDLLIEDDYQTIKDYSEKNIINKHSDYLEVYKGLSNKKKEVGLENLSEKEKILYNLMNWLSLKRKGLLMLAAYRKKVLPRIEKVHAVQEYVSLTNSVGDSIIGYVDLIADIKGVGTCILDNKTSGMEYEQDSVLSSPQLSLYIHMLEEKYNTRKAGYIVMRKSVIKNRKKICSKCGHDGSGGRHKTCDNTIDSKRCNGEWNETIDPDIYIQFITDLIPEQTEKIVLENADNINEAIKNNSFSRNLNSCNNWYGGRCSYFEKCYKGSDKGLINMNKEKI